MTAVLASGCGWTPGHIDTAAVARARAGFLSYQDRSFLEVDEERPVREESRGSVLVGELLAIFPGMFVHGLGHYYAGDYQTSAQIRRVGEFGYILMAVGGGIGVGGYYLDRTDQARGLAYSLYATGGTVGLAGITYFFTAWIYDMVDTPRAVRSGGEPPPRSAFVEALDIFD